MIRKVEQIMSKDSLVAVANTAAAATVGNGFLAFVNDNSGTISVLIGVVTLIVTIVAHVWDKKIKAKAIENDTKRLEMDLEMKRLDLKLKEKELLSK